MSPEANSGSIAINVFNSISPMPGGISGLLVTLVDNNRFFVEQYTGDSIGSVIAERYQSPITNLTTANVIKLMAVQDFGVQSVSVGDLSTNNSNLMVMAKEFETRGMEELKSLDIGTIKYFKARG